MFASIYMFAKSHRLLKNLIRTRLGLSMFKINSSNLTKQLQYFNF